MNKPIDLKEAGLIGKKEVKTEDEAITEVAELMRHMESSLASLTIGFQTLNQRIGSLEKYVGYLLEKDPHMGPKIKAQAEALKQNEKDAAPDGTK